jgi:hypothetical protein
VERHHATFIRWNTGFDPRPRYMEWHVVQTQETIREVLADGSTTAARIASTEPGLTTDQVREQLAVMCEQDQVCCLTDREPSEWMLT